MSAQACILFLPVYHDVHSQNARLHNTHPIVWNTKRENYSTPPPWSGGLRSCSLGSPFVVLHWDGHTQGWAPTGPRDTCLKIISALWGGHVGDFICWGVRTSLPQHHWGPFFAAPKLVIRSSSSKGGGGCTPPPHPSLHIHP